MTLDGWKIKMDVDCDHIQVEPYKYYLTNVVNTLISVRLNNQDGIDIGGVNIAFIQSLYDKLPEGFLGKDRSLKAMKLLCTNI